MLRVIGYSLRFIWLPTCLGLLFSSVLLSPVLADTQSIAQRPFPQHSAYHAGTLRPSLWSQAEQDQQVLAYYQQWKADYLRSVRQRGDETGYRVSFGSENPKRTVSEGQGYGMLIVALMAGADPEARDIFDGLWRFAQAWPSDIDGRLMAWQVPIEADANTSAFDGDADIAYALLLAAQQWPDGDYLTAARSVMAGLMDSSIGPDSQVPTFGDWVETDGEEYNQWSTRSSDFMPAHFRNFAHFSSDADWLKVRDRVLDIADQLQRESSAQVGLLPDFVVIDDDGRPHPAPPNWLEGVYDGHYFFNAGRDPWRLATEALLTGDERATVIAARLSAGLRQITDGDPQRMQSGYLLSGYPIPYETENNSLFVAPAGVAAMVLADGQPWLDAIYRHVYDRHQDYYEDSVTLLSMLVMTGNYWDPAAPAP